MVHSYKRTRERYAIIVASLDDITTRDPKAELIGLRDQNASNIFLRICFEHNQYSIFSTLI